MTYEEDEEEMSTGVAIGVLALLALGIYLFIKFVWSIWTNKTDVWTCGNCEFILRKRNGVCPNCSNEILWEGIQRVQSRYPPRKNKLLLHSGKNISRLCLFLGVFLLWFYFLFHTIHHRNHRVQLLGYYVKEYGSSPMRWQVWHWDIQ